MTAARGADHRLTTVLFTDIVDSSGMVAELGDRRWRVLLGRHHELVRTEIEGFGGRELDSAGDGSFASFDDPAGAIRCAASLVTAVQDLGVDIRAGLHFGNAEVVGNKLGGLVVHVGARVAAMAGPAQVLVTGVLREILAGSGLEFEDRGWQQLKGIEEEKELFALVSVDGQRLPAALDPAEARDQRDRIKAPPFVRAGQEAGGDQVRVVIADDSGLFREGVRRMLGGAGFEVVGEAGDGEKLLRVVAETEPDVVITDIRMPPTHTDEGVVAARRIRLEHPEVGVLVLSTYVDTDFAETILGDSNGRAGYLLKDRVSDLDELADAVRRIARGGTVLDPAVVSELLNRRRVRDPLQDLSDREAEVLRLMAEGRSNQAIGERLFLSPRTVEAHIRAIFTKLDLAPASDDHRRVLAVLAFLRR